MRLRAVGWGLVLAGLVAVACGDDDPSTTTCGAGTVLKGTECVAASGANGVGGDPSCSDDGCGTSGATSGGAAPNGGAVNGGGADQDAGAAGQDFGGAGAAGSAGSDAQGGAGAGGAEPGPATRWLAFEHADGAFVYDVTQFPEQDALVQLGTGSLGSWSPDGRKLLYSQQGAWYVRDLSAATPGPAVLLVEVAPASPTLAWSADSKSISMRRGTTLTVFDPATAAPSLHPLTTTLITHRWAPVGNKLVYVDGSGGHVVEVVEGVPGSPVSVDARATGWAPHGNALVANFNDGTLTLTTLDAAPPTVTTLFAPTSAVTGMEGFVFNHDGSRLATAGWKDRVEMDAFYVDLLPTVGSLELPYAPLPATQGAAFVGFSPDGDWLLYETYDDVTELEQYFAVNLAGESPGTPVPLGVPSSDDPLWLRGNGAVIAASTSATSLALFDLLAPRAPQPLLSGVQLSACALDPSRTVLGYRTARALHLLDLAAPDEPAVDIELLDVTGNVGRWGWSPDGKFIAAITLTSNDQQRLVRIDGLTASTPISLGGPSDDAVSFRWQP